MFFRVFLLNDEINKNLWHVTPESIPKFAKTFIGMPFIDDDGDNPENDGKRRHFGAEKMRLDEILSKQENFRKANIFDVEIRANNQGTELYAIVETADEKLFEEINSGEGIFVSPAISGRPVRQPCGTLLYDQWVGLHLARVDDPAYGVMRASIKQTCEGTERQCVRSLISSAASSNISFNPLEESHIMTTNSSAAVAIASEDELKKLKEENASLTKKLASANDIIKDNIEKKEKQDSQIATITSELADVKTKIAAEEEEDKKELAAKIAGIEKEDEVENAATQDELMKLDKEELARKAASANSYHAKLASLKTTASQGSAKVVRMTRTASTAALQKGREEGHKLTLNQVMEAMN